MEIPLNRALMSVKERMMAAINPMTLIVRNQSDINSSTGSVNK